jgi:hypothetical protein
MTLDTTCPTAPAAPLRVGAGTSFTAFLYHIFHFPVKAENPGEIRVTTAEGS